jgi:hypothetical protein
VKRIASPGFALLVNQPLIRPPGTLRIRKRTASLPGAELKE